MTRARTKKHPDTAWRSLLQAGPAWRGGYGLGQEDANYAFVTDLVEAAAALAPHVPRAEKAVIGLVHDLVRIAQLPIDASFGTLTEAATGVAEAFTTVFADCAGPMPDLAAALAAAATMPGSEYFVFAMSGSWTDTPFGMWLAASGAELAADVYVRIDPDGGCDEDFMAGIAELSRQTQPT